MTKALIDGDILVYSVGFANENETEDAALVAMDSKLDEITFNCGASESVIYLSGSNNFRKKLFPGYKAHRKQPKPKHFQALRNYLIKVEQAEVAEGQEADDLLGINQTQDTIICSLDKDLNQISGWHFNWRKQEAYEVSQADADRFMWSQLLTGDATDNIQGIYGLGPAKAAKLLAGCRSVDEYRATALYAYKDYFPHCSEDEVIQHINLIGKLVYIRRKPEELWSLYG